MSNNFNYEKAKVKKKIYVSHPYRGKTGTIQEVKKNVNEITEICRELLLNRNDIIIISPVHMYSFMTYSDDQELVLEKCSELLLMCDEIWLYGEWKNSEGCVYEEQLAKKHDIITKDMNGKVD
jgi:hypothetical protein